MARFRFSSSIVIGRHLDDVWMFLIDFPQVASWEQGILEARQTSPGPTGLGTTLLVRRVYFGRKADVQCRITAWDERRGVTMELRGGPLRSASVRYAVEPVGSAHTKVTYTATGELHPALQLLTPLMPALGRSDERKNLANLKILLETGNPATPSTQA
jgi:carbon monoxide dehydrogenase subunit G